MNTDEFKQRLEEEVEYINELIYKFLPEEKDKYKKISEAVNYSVKAGGKRLRPMLILESYRLCGGDPEEERSRVASFMAAMEFIHTYSLVHDDLPAMDNDLLRRGLPTTHAKFGEDFGILAGDALLNLAYEVMTDAVVMLKDLSAAKAMKVIAQKAGISGMVGGQCLDVDLTGKEMSADELDFIFKLKTGALIEASFMAGGILAGADDEKVNALGRAGYYTGMAFQIRDDILDETGNEEEIGKPVHSDEKNNKTTYVSLYGLEKADEDVCSFSAKAENILKEIGDNTFLIELIRSMVNRKK